jgi:hypothetical protein
MPVPSGEVLVLVAYVTEISLSALFTGADLKSAG